MYIRYSRATMLREHRKLININDKWLYKYIFFYMRIFSLDVTIPIKFLTLFTLLYQMVFISDDSGMLLFEIVIRMKITRRSIRRERVFSSHVSLKRKIQSTLEGFNNGARDYNTRG